MLTKQQADEATAEFVKTSEMVQDTISKMKSKQEILMYLTAVRDQLNATIHMAHTMLPR